jgi:hypothetical protein
MTRKGRASSQVRQRGAFFNRANAQGKGPAIMWKQALAVTVALGCLVPAVRADATKLDLAATAGVADQLRAVLVEAMPDPLIEEHSHWGGQRLVAHGLDWHGKGLQPHPGVEKIPRNGGRWWRVKASAVRLPDTLIVTLRDVRATAPGLTTFTAFVSFDARVEYDQQKWDRDLRLYSASAEARIRLNLMLHCEATTKLEPNGTLLPDAVFRLRVTQANLSYDHFEVDHVAGVGGDLAKIIGEAAKAGVEQWRPSLERNLLQKADAAIVKAGDTKEVRLSVLKLLSAQAR